MNATKPLAATVLSAVLLTLLVGCSDIGPLDPQRTSTTSRAVLSQDDDDGCTKEACPIPLPPAEPADPGGNDRNRP